jgi:hypothetical protein
VCAKAGWDFPDMASPCCGAARKVTTNQRLALLSACATIFLLNFYSPPCARARGVAVFCPGWHRDAASAILMLVAATIEPTMVP